ncbi:MAG: condensation domain-containing protein, partial [Anaeroplasmataceae bacterium]
MVLRDVFSNSNIHSIANKIVTNMNNKITNIEHVAEDEYYEASPSQKRMLVLNNLDKNCLDYNMPMVFKIKKGILDIVRLEDSINKIIRRHESLRTYFSYVDGVPVQLISNNKINIEVSHIKNDSLDNTICKLIKPFDLSKDLLFRVHYIYLNSKESYLFIDMHHVISDGISVNILFTELQQIYDGKISEEIIYQYKDYSNWYNKYKKTNDYLNKKNYWLDKFKTPPKNIVTELSYTEKDFNTNTTNNIVLSTILEKAIKEDINVFLKKNEITLYMYMLSVFNALIYRLTNCEDIPIGTPVSGRTLSEFENTIGLFVNTIVIRNKVNGELSFIELINEIKENVILGIESQEYAIDDLVNDLKLQRKVGENPLFDIMYLVEKVEINRLLIDGVEVVPYTFRDENLKFNINYSVIEYNDYIQLE